MDLEVDVRKYAVGWSGGVYLGGWSPRAYVSTGSFSW